MPVSRIEVDEYECALCGYKWISRINGQDKLKPSRCAKCKHQHWERGHIDGLEKSYRDALKKRFGYFNYPGGMFHGGWCIEENVKRYLEGRPSVQEMKVLLHPMSYLHEYRPSARKPTKGCVPAFPDVKHVDMKATKKALEYEKQLSRQLLKDLMIQRSIPYDENEAKIQSLYSRHGKYATFMLRHVRELCDALKEDTPEISNEDIKARVLEDFSEQLKYAVASPEELIKSCWPNWLIVGK